MYINQSYTSVIVNYSTTGIKKLAKTMRKLPSQIGFFGLLNNPLSQSREEVIDVNYVPSTIQ